jgi:hypothetical protein
LSPTSPNGTQYSTNADPQTGRFDFQRVLPGGYVAYLFVDGLTVRTPADVRSGDVDGLSLTISQGIDVPINITVDGAPPPNFPNVTGLTPTLWRNPTLLGAPAMPATAGNPPALRNIAPGDYHVYVNPILSSLQGANPLNFPANWQGAYVKSMQLDGADVLHGGMRLERPPMGALEIVIGVNPGTASGRVLNDRKEPVPGAVVTLFANAPEDRLYRTDLYRVGSTDTAGNFRLERIPPGEYRAFAWENIEWGAWIDSGFLRMHEDRGITVRVEEGKIQSAELEVISLR